MLKRRSPDQKMNIPINVSQTSPNCFLKFSLAVVVILSQFTLLQANQILNAEQKTFIDDLLHSNSITEQSHKQKTSALVEGKKFDISFKGNRETNSQPNGVTFKFKPALRSILVTSYGIGQNDLPYQETVSTNDRGLVSTNSFKPGTDLCFVATAKGANHLFWHQQCIKTPKLNRRTDVAVNLDNSEVKPYKLFLTGNDPDGTTFFPTIPLDGVSIDLHLNSETSLGLFPKHSESLTLTSNADGHAWILSNVPITGTAIVTGHTDFETFTSDLSIDPSDKSNNVHQLKLNAVCPQELNQQTSLVSLSTWTESLGLGPRPLTQGEATSLGWRQTNKRCDENNEKPGFWYENPESASDHFLGLVYDANGILCGVQVALPKSLANPNFDYEKNPYYTEGTYDGEAAYYVSLFFADQNKICEKKNSLELICADGLGGNDQELAYIISKNGQRELYLDMSEAKSNGWSEENQVNNLEVYMAPPKDDSGSPFLAIYRDSKLVGLTFLHSSRKDKREAFLNTIFEPANPLKLFSEVPTSLSQKFDDEGTLMTSFYIADHDMVHVYLTLNLGHEAHYYPRKYFYWTDTGDHGERREEGGKIDRFRVKMSTKHIYIFGYHESTSTVHYSIVKVDPCRGRHHIHATIRKGEKSRIEVHEIQSHRSLGGSHATIYLGVASKHAMQARLHLSGRATVHLDTPKGLLVAWSVEGPRHQTHLPHPDKGKGIAPFHEKIHLSKTINVDVHVCLDDVKGQSYDASDKDAVVEVTLEYEWASQDDTKEIIQVDSKGYLKLKNIKSPLPGENLNVTLVSRLGKQHYFGDTTDFHSPVAVYSHTVKYNDDGPIKVDFCHLREQLVVVVSNGVNLYRMAGVNVRVDPDDSGDYVEDKTDSEGIAFFSFKDAESVEIVVNHPGYDVVTITNEIEETKTKVVHIELYPQQTIQIEVLLEDSNVPAIGAVVRYVLEDGTDHFAGVDGEGKADIIIPGSSESLTELRSYIPWQSTCGFGSREEDLSGEPKLVFGMAEMSGETFPVVSRDGTVVRRSLTLPKIDEVNYKIGLDGTFPDIAMISNNVMARKNLTQHVEEQIMNDEVRVSIPTGARRGTLFTVEWYNNNVVATPLNPCVIVTSDAIAGDGKQIVLSQSIFQDTVKVTLKTVDQDFNPCNNVTIEYIMGETEFGVQTLDVSQEGEIFFHLPYGMLVSIDPKSPMTPDPMNPQYFVARPDLEVVLVFDIKNSANVIVELIGEDFNVPEDTLVRYLAVDSDGDVVSSEALFTDAEGRVYFKTRRNVQYIEFSIGGSDGFDPVFYQPFDYVYNVTNPLWTPPLTIEIPVRTLKNVIVAVRDCFSGELIPEGAIATVPQDAPRWNSWFNTLTMSSSYEGQTDEQGLVFFNLEPDQLVSVRVKAKGYKDFEDKINIKSNVTYLVEANMCKDVTITLKLVDAGNENRPIDRATVTVGLDDTNVAEIEVITNEHGQAKFEVPTSTKRLTLHIVDASHDIKDPVFELHDEVDFLKEADIEIVVNDRMHTIELYASSCDGETTYEDVPVLVSVCYSDSEICYDSAKMPDFATYMTDYNLGGSSQFVVKSKSDGLVKFHVKTSATKVSAAIMSAPPSNPKATNVGLTRAKELSDKIEYAFYGLKKQIILSVKDNHEEKLSGATVTFGYFNPSAGQDQSQVAKTDQNGRAEVFIDGCVKTMSFEVDPPDDSGSFGHCYNSGSHSYGKGYYKSAKKSNLDVTKDQKFKINLEESKGRNHKKVRLSVRSGVNQPDEVRLTTDVDLWSPINLNHQQDPFFNNWHVEISHNARRAFIVETDQSSSMMGLVDVSLCCSASSGGSNFKVDGFTGSVQVHVYIVNQSGDPVDDARLHWHVGHGLGSVSVPVDSRGKVTIWAPPGEPLVLRPLGSSCGDYRSTIEDARAENSITLRCKK